MQLTDFRIEIVSFNFQPTHKTVTDTRKKEEDENIEATNSNTFIINTILAIHTGHLLW